MMLAPIWRYTARRSGKPMAASSRRTIVSSISASGSPTGSNKTARPWCFEVTKPGLTADWAEKSTAVASMSRQQSPSG